MSTAVNSLKLTFSNYVGAFFFSIRGLIIAKLLGPAYYGIWCALNVIIGYSQFSHLGLLYAQTKEVPFYKEKKDNDKIQSIFVNTFTFSVLASLLFSLGVIFFAVHSFIKKDLVWGVGLIITAGVCVLDQVYRFYINFLRANEEFGLLYKYNLFYSFSSLVLLSLGVFFFKFNGLLIAFFISYLVIIYYIMVLHNKKLSFYLELSIVRGLIRVGFPLMIYALSYVLFNTVDRLLIMWLLNVKSLGYYSFALSIAEITTVFATGIGFVYFPKLIREFAARGNPEDLQGTFLNITKALMIIAPLALSITFLGSVFLIKLWYKSYLDALIPLTFILLGKYFMIFSSIAGCAFIALNDIKSLMKITFFAIAISLILDFFVISLGFKINGIAFVSLISNILYSCLLNYRVIKKIRLNNFSLMKNSVFYFLLLFFQFSLIFIITKNNLILMLHRNLYLFFLIISISLLILSSLYLLKNIIKTEFIRELINYFKGLSKQRYYTECIYDEMPGNQ